MKRQHLLLLGLLMAACSPSTQTSETSDVPAAPGWGDDYIARRVSGIYLLSTDYHYQEVCNYLPEAFVRKLFDLGDVELTKYSRLNSCELRWGPNSIGFFMESEKPFESVFRSEYYFNKRFDPQSNRAIDQNAGPKPTIYGPAPQGTASTGPANNTAASPAQDSARGYDPLGPIAGMTEPKPALVTPAHNTATGRAVTGVGDKAIWEPGKKALHVLYNNHVFSVVARMPGDTARLKQGTMNLAKLVIDSITDDRDPRD